MKKDQSIIIGRKSIKKIFKILIFLVVGVAASLLMNDVFSFNFYRSFFVNAELFILGLIITVCISGILFSFVKRTPKRLALCCAIMSLLLGAMLCYNYFKSIGEFGTLPGFEDDLTVSLILAFVFHFAYAVVIYALSMLVYCIVKKIDLKRHRIC